MQYTIIYIEKTLEIPNLPWIPKLTNEKSEIKRQLCDCFYFCASCLFKIHNRKKFITLMPCIIMSSNFANMFITQMSDFYKFLFYNFLLINPFPPGVANWQHAIRGRVSRPRTRRRDASSASSFRSRSPTARSSTTARSASVRSAHRSSSAAFCAARTARVWRSTNTRARLQLPAHVACI